MHVPGKNHDQVLKDAKTRIADEIKEIAEKEAQHTSSGTCTKDPNVIFSTCETCQTSHTLASLLRQYRHSPEKKANDHVCTKQGYPLGKS